MSNLQNNTDTTLTSMLKKTSAKVSRAHMANIIKSTMDKHKRSLNISNCLMRLLAKTIMLTKLPIIPMHKIAPHKILSTPNGWIESNRLTEWSTIGINILTKFLFLCFSLMLKLFLLKWNEIEANEWSNTVYYCI